MEKTWGVDGGRSAEPLSDRAVDGQLFLIETLPIECGEVEEIE
jgi:hypothetical protein